MALPRQDAPAPAAIPVPPDRPPPHSYGDDHRQPLGTTNVDSGFAEWYQQRFGTPAPPPPAAGRPQPATPAAATPAPAAAAVTLPGPPRPAPAAPPTSYGDERRAPGVQLVEVLKGLGAETKRKAATKQKEGQGRRGSTYNREPNSYADDRREPTIDLLGGQPTDREGTGRRGSPYGRQPMSHADDRRTPGPTVGARAYEPPTDRKGRGRRGSGYGRRGPQAAEEEIRTGALEDETRSRRPDKEAEAARQTKVFTANETIAAPPSRASGKRMGKGDVPGRTRGTRTRGYDPNAVADTWAIYQDALAAEANSTPVGPQGARFPERRRGQAEAAGPVLDVDSARADYKQAVRDERAHAIGADVSPNKPLAPISTQVDRMTWQEYNALAPAAKSAVDFNAGLVRSVRKDRHSQDLYAPTDKERERYDKEVTAMFGRGRGSDTYAPETVALLKQIGYSDHSGDLDDFLGLKAAVHEKDLQYLDTGGLVAPEAAQPALEMLGVPTSGPLDLNQSQMNRVTLAQDLTRRSAVKAPEVMAQGEKMLQSFTASAALDRNSLVDRYGGVENKPHEALGFGDPVYDTLADGSQVPHDVNTYIQSRFAAMVDSSQKDPNQILQDIALDLTPEEMKFFFTFARNQIDAAKRYGIELEHAPEVRPRSLAELDSVFGGGTDTEGGRFGG